VLVLKPVALIKCNKCNFNKFINKGEEFSIKDVYEYPRSCVNCGSTRKFRCPTCGNMIKLVKIKN